MKKYGFVYLWYDSYRKMYYIGCHWGTVKDGYICSSNRMRDAYRRRPQDFKRRILKTNIDRCDLLEEEFKWLSLIKDDELGTKYYNFRKHHYGHWSNDLDKSLTISEKISKANKGKSLPKNKKWRKNLSKSLSNKPKSKEHAVKCRLHGAKTYVVCNPKNEVFEVFCLKDFAKEIGFKYDYLARVASGRRKQYKGYKIAKKV